MTVAHPHPRHGFVHRARQVLRSPKGYMLVLMGAIATLGTLREDIAIASSGLAVAAGTAMAADIAMRMVTRQPVVFPSGAILTGLVVGLVLDPYAPLLTPILAVSIGIASKYLIRDGTANVFNPAAFGLVAAHLIFGQGESWWGGLPAYGVLGAILVLVPGAWIADHINKLPLILVFFGTYFGLFTLTAFTPAGIEVAEVFGAPGAHMAIFFACYMLDDPPTSPTRYVDQVWYGALVAVLAYGLFMTTQAVYFLAAALIIGNVANDIRRRRQSRHRHPRLAPAGVH